MRVKCLTCGSPMWHCADCGDMHGYVNEICPRDGLDGDPMSETPLPPIGEPPHQLTEIETFWYDIAED